MLLSRQLANFTRGESDTLRKAMGKKLIDKMNHLKGKFLEGGQANGHDPAVLNKIWADWEKFASYAFNKSHATCYSWVAFQTAYLKANYPSEYMAAVLSRNLSDINKLTTFMDECKAMKVAVKGPDVNESYSKFGVNQAGDIRFGLSAIKGVGVNVVDGIIRARDQGGRFTDIYDFMERVEPGAINRRVLESLALAGAFDCFADIKREDFVEPNSKGETFSELLIRYGQQFHKSQQQQQASLFSFGDIDINTGGRPPVPHAVAWDNVVRLEKERELVGMYLSAHPLDKYYMELNYGLDYRIKDLEDTPVPEGRDFTFGGMVVSYDVRTARSGTRYAILKVEDYTGSMEVRLFNRQMIDYGKYGIPGLPIVITARYQKRHNSDELSMNLMKIQTLDEVAGQLVSDITINLSAAQVTHQLTEMLKEHKDSSKNALGSLNLCIFDPAINRSVSMRSSHRIPINRKLVDMLREMEIEFSIS